MNIQDFRLISITINILCMLITSLLGLIYISKKKIVTKENSVYNALIACNMISLILELVFYLTSFRNGNDSFVKVIEKVYFSSNSVWMFLYFVYILVIVEEQVKNKISRWSIDKKKRISMIIICSIIFLVFILPIENIYEDGLLVGSTGPSTLLVFFICFMLTLLDGILVFISRKTIKKSKVTPLILFVFIIFLELIANILGFKLLLMTLPMTLVCFLMYHTIENPDAQMIEQLNIAKDQAVKANAAKTDFLSNMSHEIRTPLNAIVGFSNLLLEDSTVPDRAKDEVKDIIMASDNLLEIVNGILDISKIEANKIEIVNGEYSTKKIFDELVALTKGRLGDKPIEFKTDIAKDLPQVLYGDAQRLKQICVNILTNAVKYTKEGWIEFKISTILKNNVCRLIISVEDTGIGIKNENIDKLFNRFERIDMEENLTIEGTGLGLAITKKLVELMNGKIVVQSVYGKGSKFTVSIDQKIVDNPTIKIEENPAVKEEIKVKDRKILLVDDNKINLKVAERLLESYGVITESLESGFKCLDKLKSGNKYDLILLDDMMPKMSGVETLKKIKTEIPDFATPVVALTANALTGMKEKYLADGFNDYLAKPINKEELNRVINEYLNKE